MAGISGRALHYVFKVADRKQTARFYREVLGMKVLRHEEFSDGCEAACNGPYANRWSKTMMGYGPEDTHFVVEITYNYPIKSYKKGNDFVWMTIKSKEILERARDLGWPILPDNVLEAPGGYKFNIISEPQPPQPADPVQSVTIATSDLKKSIEYWNGKLDLQIFNQTDKSVLLGYGEGQAKLEILDIGEPIDRAEAYGRIAFACPNAQLADIDKKIREANLPIITPLIKLDTPGKASVHVIILSDPNDHEICFVDEEGFRELSVIDPEGDKLLERYMRKD